MHCAAPGCGRSPWARGLCNMHYGRWRRGDITKGNKNAHGAAVAFIEVILAYTGDACVMWPYPLSAGYGACRTDGRSRLAHRIICERVHGAAPPGQNDAAHSCGIRRCVNPTHIRWASRAENEHDRVRHGTSNRGRQNGNAKLTAQQVQAIRASEAPGQQLSGLYCVSEQTISNVRRRRSWAWLKEGV